MQSINPYAVNRPRFKNNIDFLAYKNQCDKEDSKPAQFKRKCADENCIGHPEEYTCDPCLSNMGLNDNYPFNKLGKKDPLSESVCFEEVHNAMMTSSNQLF